jgi:hypothetical protein
MDEAEFDSSADWKPFESEDAAKSEAQAARCTSLAAALWGKTSVHLQRQLHSPYPVIPPGFELTDLRKLEQWAESMISNCFGNPRFSWLPRAQGLSEWQARLEIVRRAIEYLERH